MQRLLLTVATSEIVEQFRLEHLWHVEVFAEDCRRAIASTALERGSRQVLGCPCRDPVPAVVGSGVGGPDEQIRHGACAESRQRRASQSRFLQSRASEE